MRRPWAVEAREVALDTVEYEYKYEDAVREDGVTTCGESRGAWFRDPEGNAVSVETNPRMK